MEQRDKPSLRGKPVVVSGTGWRGVVATASYEARAFGIGSAMPTALARRLCPRAAYLAPRFAAYQRVSSAVLAVLREMSAVVEPLSLDEAYVDLGPRHPDLDVARATELAAACRAAVLDSTGLTASVGVGTSKLIAKIASELSKPDGLRVVPVGGEAALLAPLPVRRLPGVGPVTGQRLVSHGFATVGTLAHADLSEVVGLVGRAHGSGLLAHARGVDTRSVTPERDVRSVSAEETFATDLTDRALLEHHVRRLAGRVAQRLTSGHLTGRTVTIKMRRFDFTTSHRSATSEHPVGGVTEIAGPAIAMLRQTDVADGVRLLGVGVSGLSEYAQQDLLAGLEPPGAPAAVPGAADQAAGERRAGRPGDGLTPAGTRDWRPGQDVLHGDLGPGWVQGAGAGVFTVRFEGPRTAAGRVRSFRVDDPSLEPAEPPVW